MTFVVLVSRTILILKNESSRYEIYIKYRVVLKIYLRYCSTLYLLAHALYHWNKYQVVVFDPFYTYPRSFVSLIRSKKRLVLFLRLFTAVNVLVKRSSPFDLLTEPHNTYSILAIWYSLETSPLLLSFKQVEDDIPCSLRKYCKLEG